MTLVVVLMAPWLAAWLLTQGLARLEALFTPEWLMRVLAATGVVLALATWTSALATAVTLADLRKVPSMAVALALGACLLWTATGGVAHGWRAGMNLRSGRLFRASPARVGDLLTVDSDVPDAFAVPGRRGVVVVTTALASAMRGDELAAVVRHERAHLAGHHQMFIQAIELAARLNPLLRSWRDPVRFAAERAADECAARPDRGTALRAVARAAVVCSAARSPGWVGIAGPAGEVVRRVRALQRPGPAPQRIWLLAATGLLVAALSVNLAMAADVTQDRVAPEDGEPAVAVLS